MFDFNIYFKNNHV